jgi:hypothetical protein
MKAALPVTPAGALPVAATPASGPLTFEAAAPDGRWLVTCQARVDTNGDGRVEVGVSESGELTGDAMVRYLTFASGGEQAIDALLAASADGRWLVFEREGRSELYDTDTGARLDLSALGADTRREPGPSLEHRSLAFADDRLFYVRTSGPAQEVVERRLSTASERPLFRGAEAIVRLELDRGGKKLLLKVAGADSNKNGRSDFPHALERGKAPCVGPVPRFQVERQSADAQSQLVVDRASGEAIRVDDLAAIVGETLLRRDPEGALFADGKRGRRQIADKNCSGRVLWIDAASEELLLGCALPKRPGRLGVEFLGRAGRKPLEIDVAQLAFDEPAAASARLVALYPGADTVLFDFEKQFLHRLKSGDAVLASAGPHALIRRGRTALTFDAETGTLAPLPGRLDPLGSLLRQGSLVLRESPAHPTSRQGKCSAR